MADSQDEENEDFDSTDEGQEEVPSDSVEESDSPPRKVRKAAQVAHLAWSGKQPKTPQMLARKSSGYAQSSELLFDYEPCEPLPEHKIGRTDHQTFYSCVRYELLPLLAKTRPTLAVPIAPTSVVKVRGKKDWMIVCSLYRNNDKGNWRFFGAPGLTKMPRQPGGKRRKPRALYPIIVCS